MSMTPTATPTVLGPAQAVMPTHRQPLFGSRVRAGFPSPADDHPDNDIDLHARVVKRMIFMAPGVLLSLTTFSQFFPDLGKQYQHQ
jgi:hypothetical protein